MEAEVHVEAENPITGERTHTNTAYLVYVAMDEDGQPVPVPALIPETEAQQRRMQDGKARQEHRKSHAASEVPVKQ